MSESNTTTISSAQFFLVGAIIPRVIDEIGRRYALVSIKQLKLELSNGLNHASR